MESREHFLASTGRVIMETIQSEWEPLSHMELDQRLERALEEMIEADLMAQAQGQSTSVFLQAFSREDSPSLPEDPSQTPSLELSEPPGFESKFEEPTSISDAFEQTPKVQYVTQFLQRSNKSDSRTAQKRLSGRARLSLSHTVLLSLTLLTKRVSYRSVSASFHLEKGNIHRIFFSFCDQVVAQQERVILWPAGQAALKHLHPFSSWLGHLNESLEEKGLPQVLGALGHTRIPIRLLSGQHVSLNDSDSDSPEPKRGKNEPHPDSWLNLELICNGEGRFIYCHISKGSEKDRGSALLQRLQQNPQMMPPGTCLVAKVGYPLTGQILTPFSTGRSPQENLYNRSVGVHLGRFDQAVADLKERFQKLRYLDISNYDRSKIVVLTACILNNLYVDMGDVTKGLIDKNSKEEPEEAKEDAVGIKRREDVVNLLYSALESESQ